MRDRTRINKPNTNDKRRAKCASGISGQKRSNPWRDDLCASRLTAGLTGAAAGATEQINSQLEPRAPPFAFSIFHLSEIDLEMDPDPELINFNLIPPMHHYLHNATGGSRGLVCSE